MINLTNQQIQNIAKQALVFANNKYLNLSIEEQEKYRDNKPSKDKTLIDQFLLKKLFQLKCKKKEVDDYIDDLSPESVTILNHALLFTTGIGEDYLFLNEFMGDDDSILNYQTLYEYDYKDYLFQEEARKKESKEYQGSDYFAFQHPRWVRLLVEHDFYYATITSIARHLYDELTDLGRDKINELIPHEFKHGKNHGKADKGGYLFDLKTDAHGQEKQLEELNDRFYQYLSDCWNSFGKRYKDNSPGVFINDEQYELSADNENNIEYIFMNEKSINNIRWKHFTRDIKPLIQSDNFLKEEINKESEKLYDYLEEQHKDIMENFDPKIVKFKKKMKVILSPEAADDIGI